jgi:hypothetical protein
MFMALYALAVALLVLGVLWAEARLSWSDNALLRALDAWDDWRWSRQIRAHNARIEAAGKARLEAAG